jgi:hypothetical protein
MKLVLCMLLRDYVDLLRGYSDLLNDYVGLSNGYVGYLGPIEGENKPT